MILHSLETTEHDAPANMVPRGRRAAGNARSHFFRPVLQSQTRSDGCISDTNPGFIPVRGSNCPAPHQYFIINYRTFESAWVSPTRDGKRVGPDGAARESRSHARIGFLLVPCQHDAGDEHGEDGNRAEDLDQVGEYDV